MKLMLKTVLISLTSLTAVAGNMDSAASQIREGDSFRVVSELKLKDNQTLLNSNCRLGLFSGSEITLPKNTTLTFSAPETVEGADLAKSFRVFMSSQGNTIAMTCEAEELAKILKSLHLSPVTQVVGLK